MTLAVKDAGGNTVNLPTSSYDANGNLLVALTAAPLPTGAAKSTDIAAVVQALAPLATDADLQAVTAKMEAVRALLAAVLNVQGTVTANLGTLNGVALDASVQAVRTSLGTPAQTADVNAATAKMEAVRALLAATLTVGGSAAVGSPPVNPPLSVSGVDGFGNKRHLLTDTTGTLQVAQAGAIAVAATGIGSHTAVPAGSTNGTAVGTRPAGNVRGVLLELQAGDSITFSIQAAQPAAAPLTRTLTVPSGGLLSQYFADLAPGVMLYVTASAGSPLFRWI